MNPGHRARSPGDWRCGARHRSPGPAPTGTPEPSRVGRRPGPSPGTGRGRAGEFVIVCRHVTGVQAALRGPVGERCGAPAGFVGLPGSGLPEEHRRPGAGPRVGTCPAAAPLGGWPRWTGGEARAGLAEVGKGRGGLESPRSGGGHGGPRRRQVPGRDRQSPWARGSLSAGQVPGPDPGAGGAPRMPAAGLRVVRLVTPVKAAPAECCRLGGACGLLGRVVFRTASPNCSCVLGNSYCITKTRVTSVWSLNLAFEVCIWRSGVGARTGCVSHSVSKRW